MVKERQLYDILEVSTEADEQEIRRAYKALALKYHPDKQPATSDADKEKMTEMFKAVSKAYDVLSDNSKRYLYDTYGEEVAVNPQEQTSVFTTNNRQYDHGAGSYAQQHQHQQHQHHQFGHTQGQRLGFPSAFSAQDMMSSHFASSNDMFNHIFNDFGANSFMNSFKAPFGMFDSGGGGSSSNNNNNNNNNNNGYNEEPSRKKTVAKGKDIMDTVSCSLLDYYNGKHIKMSLCKRVKCPKCKGCGGLKIYTCNDCCGTGYIINEARNGMMYQRTQSTCARCQGTGEFIPAKYICDECGGNKLIDTKVIFDFKSPRGVGDGYRVVFPRAADEGVNLIPGDVVITLKDDPNDSTSKYRRLGNNLLTTISVPLVKALCGGRISLEHIDGKKVDIFIACGELKSANEFKVLRGYGMPIHKNSSSSSSSKSENTGGNMSSDNASGNSDPAEDGNGDRPEYGDLIIRFDISFPDITAFSNKRVDLLGKVLGSSFPKDGLQMGGVSSSSSSEDISSSADDLSSFRMGESSMSSLAKNLKLSDSDTTASASVSNTNSTSNSHGHGTNIDISKKRALDADNDDIRYRSSHSDDSGRVRAPLARPGKASSFHAARLQDPDADLRTTLSVHDFPSVAADICFEDLDPAASMKNSNALHTSEPMDARNNPFKRTKAAEDPSSS